MSQDTVGTTTRGKLMRVREWEVEEKRGKGLQGMVFAALVFKDGCGDRELL